MMKILSLILAFYVILLSTGPRSIDENCGDNNHSSTTELPKHNEDANDCKECCSPFFTCGTCSGFSYPALAFTMTKPVTSLIKKAPTSYSFIYSEFHSSIWQPPKIS